MKNKTIIGGIMSSNIKLLCVDVDGTLTNGNCQMSDNGVLTKTFCSKDFDALKIIQDKGILVFILTLSIDKCIINRVNHYPEYYRHNIYVYTYVKDKKKFIDDYLIANNLSWNNVAYIGDSHNDISSMELAKHIDCPFDAIDEVRGVVKSRDEYVSSVEGGKGCVYDFVNHLIKNSLI